MLSGPLPGGRFLYFAYGSNMSSHRLAARTPSARFVAAASVPGVLCFHKVGRDGSGKCSIAPAGNGQDRVWGVLWDIAAADQSRLDAAEGLGQHYRIEHLQVQSADGEQATAVAYIALALDPHAVPFDWYHQYVLQGAIEHGLPPCYVAALRAVPVVPDADTARRAANQMPQQSAVPL